MARILVTGASGFVGRRLVSLLRRREGDQAAEILAMSTAPVPGVETIVVKRTDAGIADFANADFAPIADGVDCVFHLASFTPKRGSEANAPQSTANVINTYSLISALPRPSRFIFASTLDVYGSSTVPLREDASPQPQSLYGASKLYCEQLLKSWAEEHPKTRLTVARIGHLFGPGEDAYGKLIPETIRRLKRGEAPKITSSGTELRSLMYVDDCCEALSQLMHVENLPLVNISSARAVTVEQVVRQLCDIATSKGVTVPDWSPEDEYRAPDVVMDVSTMGRHIRLDETPLDVALTREFESM